MAFKWIKDKVETILDDSTLFDTLSPENSKLIHQFTSETPDNPCLLFWVNETVTTTSRIVEKQVDQPPSQTIDSSAIESTSNKDLPSSANSNKPSNIPKSQKNSAKLNKSPVNSAKVNKSPTNSAKKNKPSSAAKKSSSQPSAGKKEIVPENADLQSVTVKEELAPTEPIVEEPTIIYETTKTSELCCGYKPGPDVKSSGFCFLLRPMNGCSIQNSPGTKHK